MGTKINIEFQKALEKKKILPFEKGKKLINNEFESAQDDIKEAQDRFNNERYKYATINAYYSMFHCARSLIYSKGYREKSHYYLIVALQTLFVDKGLLDKSLLEAFHDAMILREDADYHATFSKEGAQSNIESAKSFLVATKSIL